MHIWDAKPDAGASVSLAFLGPVGKTTVLAATVATLVVAIQPPASALPSYARQTGQPCATCHTDFPGLTPYGRRFKLMAYTAGGTYCGGKVPIVSEVSALRDYLAGTGSSKDGATASSAEVGDSKPGSWMPPIAFMAIPTFTHLNTKAINADGSSANGQPPDNPQPSNNIFDEQTTSAFYGGQIYCNVGAFIQVTHDPSSGNGNIFLDNTDIRFANLTKIGGVDVIYGVSVNNGMTVQDVYNTTPAWGYPYIGPSFSGVSGIPSSSFIEGAAGSKFLGVTAYTMINDMLLLEAGGYRSLDGSALSVIGIDPSGPVNIDGIAPYWRAALEINRNEHSFMFGTFGTIANIYTPGSPEVGTDQFTDIGLDAQYQYIGQTHTFVLKSSYIKEWQKLTAQYNLGNSEHLSDTIRSFRITGTYVYDKRLSFTASYFNVSGSEDALVYASNAVPKPNTDGYSLDMAYMPFAKGGPEFWPWYNARIGIQFTLFNKYAGSTTAYDSPSPLGPVPRNASDNDTVLVYWWNAF